MKVAYNRFWREKFNEEEAKSGKPRGTSGGSMLTFPGSAARWA